MIADLERRRFVLLAAGGLLAAKFAGAAAQDRTTGIRGRQAPALNVSYWIDRSGESTDFSMDDITGKWVYLKFFQNWCPGCHEYGFPALKRIADRYADDPRVAVLAVQTVFEGFTVNTRASVRKLQLRYSLPIRMGHDAGDPEADHLPLTMRQYRSGGTPWVVIIDPTGVVVYNDFHVDPDRFIAFLDAELAKPSSS